LAGSGIPTSLDEFDWLLNQGVKSIVTMTENALPSEWTQKIDYLHVPTADFHAPDMEKIDSAVNFIRNQIQNNQSVMVHCAAGLGRAGTILACYFIKYEKYSAIQAIEKIRSERPGSIQSDVQELAISYYEKYVRN
jgi:atypical dual specificity phosphatase